MENLQNMPSESHPSRKWGWVLSMLIVFGSLIILASFANVTSAASLAQAATPTMPPMPGMNATPTAMPSMPGMPGIETPTATPGSTQPQTGYSVDALIQKMQAMMQSLNGMMGQLDQKGASLAATPTATPTTPSVDMQAIMAEIQSINQVMGPLMTRIQADLQGTPTAEEIAAVRSQVEQIYGRMANLMSQLMAENVKNIPVGITPVPAATMVPMQGMEPGTMPGLGQSQPTPGSPADPSQALTTRLGQMMQKMQELMQQMQSQQSGGMSGQPGTMPGMSMASPTPMPGMATTPGLPAADPSMRIMMSMMDDMKSIMNGMAGMNGQGNTMIMATPTPMPGMNTMPGMSPADPAMNGMMMNDMLKMMDDMMRMMDSMMEMMGKPGM